MQTIFVLGEKLKALGMTSVFLRLSLAAAGGGLIGLERGHRRQVAGMRTHMLVCMGAALVMCTNQYIFNEFGMADPSRMGAQVISGIGFLGVGTIIVDKQNQVKGLTTAAGLWACACMGLAIGIGFYAGAVTACIFIFLTIVLINRLEYSVLRKTRVMEIRVDFEQITDVNRLNNYLSEEGVQIIRMEVLKGGRETGQRASVPMSVNLLLRISRRAQHMAILCSISSLDGICSVEEI